MNRHDHSPPTRRTLIALTGASLLVAGCGNIIGPGKPLQLYVLDPPLPARSGAAAQPVNWQLTVALPQAPASLDTERIALNPTPATMDYFANASWPDRLPQLVQSLLLQSFENDGRVGAVARDTSGLHADYMLQTEIHAFQAHYATPDQAPNIVLRIGVTLVHMPDGKIIDHRELHEEARAETNALPAIVAAFNTAMGGMLADIVNWAVATAPPLPDAVSKGDALSPPAKARH
jgi:cholesterol transport system auxiliary component